MLFLRAIYHQFFFMSRALQLSASVSLYMFLLPSHSLSSFCLVLVFNVLFLMIINRLLLLMLALNLSLNSFFLLSTSCCYFFPSFLLSSLLSHITYLKISTYTFSCFREKFNLVIFRFFSKFHSLFLALFIINENNNIIMM